MGAANRASVAGAAEAGVVTQLDNGARSYLPRVPDNNSSLDAATTPAASCTVPAAITVASSTATVPASRRTVPPTTTAALARRRCPRPPRQDGHVRGDGALPRGRGASASGNMDAAGAATATHHDSYRRRGRVERGRGMAA